MSHDHKNKTELTFDWPATVRVEHITYERLKRHAEAQGVTVSELVEQALATVGVH